MVLASQISGLGPRTKWFDTINKTELYIENNDNENNYNKYDLMYEMERMNDDGYNEVWIAHNLAWGNTAIVLVVGLIVMTVGGMFILNERQFNTF